MVAAGGYAFWVGGAAPWIFAAALLGVFISFYFGSIGGADAKILVVLAGFWPAALIGSLLAQGIWGLIVLLRKGRDEKFRAIPSYAAGTMISLLMNVL